MIVVIGGGAAGMFAAIWAARSGAQVCLVEPNPYLGKKLNITGKGRCNLTNATDMEGLLQNTLRNPRFLYSAFAGFSVQDTMDFFENLGVPLKTERGNRVFPESDRARDITDALERELHALGVSVVHSRAEKIMVENGCVCGVKLADRILVCNGVIVATGGLSYPTTGSTGDGYRMAEELGHTIVEPSGSLVPLSSHLTLCQALQGLSLKNVTLTALDENGKTVFSEIGEMLFTHFGVSGPLVLSASAHLPNGKGSLVIDLKPGLTREQLDARILRDFSAAQNRDFGNVLSGLLPRTMIGPILTRIGAASTCKVHSVTRAMREKLVEELKTFTIPALGKRPITEAIVTSGGVSVREVSPKTMGSKLVSGLFFAGEVLDVDGYTGGFNLQIAWSTGYLAGVSAAEYALYKGE
ncbi:MAG: NAD(P)/FAD-dependent oxidoreductase [Ruminococcaceae bacterium]|nr:NAD(P)/FAD-dependent oxidoreductase [Oscillospiraceae bacterium]